MTSTDQISIAIGVLTVIIVFGSFVAESLEKRFKQRKFVSSNFRRIITGDMTGGDTVGRFTVNGRVIQGNDIQVSNGRVIVDGVDLSSDLGDMKHIMEIRILEGSIENLSSDVSVNCLNITGNARAGGSINCDNIGGNAEAGGSINCDDINGNAKAGGSIRADTIHGGK